MLSHCTTLRPRPVAHPIRRYPPGLASTLTERAHAIILADPAEGWCNATGLHPTLAGHCRPIQSPMLLPGRPPSEPCWSTPLFGLGKTERAEREIHEIQTRIIGQSLGTAAGFEAAVQMVVAIESSCFFLQALSRLSYRPANEKLRERVFDSSVRAVVRTLANFLRQWSKNLDTPALEADILGLVSIRELEYARATTLLSEKFNDRESAVWLAAFRVAESAGIPDRDILALPIMTALVRSLVDMDLAQRIRRVEACL
jgi:hypothetical protein